VAERRLPRYPVYVPSKGRYDVALTAKFLIRDEVPFKLVVEPAEREEYEKRFGAERVLVLPNDGMRLVGARNWIKDHATAEGHARHWQLDDNISGLWRWWRGRRLYCRAGIALAVTEDFVDRYENVAIAGLNYVMFGVQKSAPPFYLNVHVYSCTLISNAIPHRWRLVYNDDTDICLQVLADGWCTVLMNAFLAQKITTMVIKGGNTADLYQGDGRLKMARALERVWPGVVTTKRRFKRPQHVIRDSWKRFDTPLKLKPGVDLSALPPVDEYGMKVTALTEIRSPALRRAVEEAEAEALLKQGRKS